MKQINFGYRLLLSLSAEEQEISDKLESSTFEGAEELAGQRVIGVALSAGEKKNAQESIGTIVALSLAFQLTFMQLQCLMQLRFSLL